MDTSIFLARIIGSLFVLVGIGVLLNITHYRAMVGRFLNSPELYYFSGAAALVVGMAIVLHHNFWTTDWRVIITIVGWISVLKGVVRIVAPAAALRLAHGIVNSDLMLKCASIALLAVGAWLAYAGFRV